MLFLEIAALVALTAALTRYLRQAASPAALREWIRSRSALLDQLLTCPHCLSFWIAVAGTAVIWAIRDLTAARSLGSLEAAFLVLLGWRGAFYINRSLDQRQSQTARRAELSCLVCDTPYDEETFLERSGMVFCSSTCWFDYLRARPVPRSQLVDRSGGIIRQEMYSMSYTDVTNEQASHLLEGDAGHVYVDVRSVPEFQNGHPAGATNVPLLHREALGMVPNPDFLTVMEVHFPRDTKLILGCQSGRRSASAAQALVAAGFTDVSHTLGGYGGVRTPTGQTVHKGWLELGLHTEYGDPDGRSYAALAGGRGGLS